MKKPEKDLQITDERRPFLACSRPSTPGPRGFAVRAGDFESTMKLFPPHADTQDQALQALLTVADSLPPDRLPALIGRLEEVKTRAFARLTAPAPTPSEPDRALDVKEAAQRLGVSVRFLYANHDREPYRSLKCSRTSRKLQFSNARITQFLNQTSLY
jgi:hypothetical protein